MLRGIENVADVTTGEVIPRDVEFLDKQIDTTSNPHAQEKQKRIPRQVDKRVESSSLRDS